MKKILYYVNLFIIATFLTFCFNKNVLAACENLSANECRETSRGKIIVSGNNYKYRELSEATLNEHKYTATYKYNSVGITYSKATASDPTFYAYDDGYSAVYCFDPQLPGIDPLRAGRFLLDTSESPKIQILDYALLSILTNNGNDILYNAQAHNSKDYWARLLALRAIIYTFGEYNSADAQYKGYYYASLTTLNEWLKDSTIADLHKKLGDKLSELKQNSLKEKSTFTKNLAYKFSGDESLNKAKQYYINALKEAIEYAEKLTSSKNVKIESSSTQGIINRDPSKNYINIYLTTNVVHTMKVSGLTTDDSFIINNVKLAKQYTGLTFYVTKIKIGNKTYTYNNSNRNYRIDKILNVNLLDLGFDFTNETTIEITITFSGYEKSGSSRNEILKCSEQPIKYYVEGTYSVNETNKYSDYVGTIWYTGPKQQRYIGVEKTTSITNDVAIPLDSEGKAKLIEACGCDELKELCDSGNNNSCKEYNVSCAKCNTTHEANYECCDENNNLEITTLDNHPVNINGPEDAKLCFVDQVDALREVKSDYTQANAVDDKGNSYTILSNKYCTVSCKEDYAMTMPGARLVNAGRYFTFSATINGTKTCYTNTIDKNQYDEDILNAQVKLINAYYLYKKWETAYAPFDKTLVSEEELEYNKEEYIDEYNDFSYKCTGCQYDKESESGDCEDIEEKECVRYDTCFEFTGKEAYIYNGEIKLRNKKFDDCFEDDGGRSDTSYSKSSWKYDLGCSLVMCRDGSKTRLISNLKSMKKEAENDLKEAQNEFNNIINAYKSCTYSYIPKEINYGVNYQDIDIYYDYEEKYFSSKQNMDYTVVSSPEDEFWYCQGNVTDLEYSKCNNGNGVSNIEGTYITENYYYCNTTDGCKIEDFTISNAKYAKRKSNIELLYKPKTLFYNIYSNGKITNTSTSKNVSLKNSLPVSVNTSRGIYKYVINITNLGEFYEYGELGRLIGGGNKAVIDKDRVEYTCAYLVNIPQATTGDVVCDWNDCQDGNCTSNCIGPNCDGCDSGDCVSTCIGTGCLYEEGNGLSVYERMVSLNKLFPHGTTSYNWNDSNQKAKETIKDIEETNKGNEIYNDTPIFSITIDATDAAQIRKYNDIAEKDNNGGYSNDTLDCRSLKVGSKTYAEIACFSTFITDLINGKIVDDDEGNKGNIDVKLNSSKIKDINKYREVKNITSSSNGYFTGWNSVPDDRTGPGPSWK